MSRYFLVALMCVLVSPVFPHELLITEAALATSPEEHISHFPNGHDEVKAEATRQLPVSETIDAAAIDHGDLLDFFGTNKKKQQKAADRAYQGYLHQQHASKDQDVQHQLKVWMGILIGALVISFTLNAVSAFFYHQEMSTPIPVVTAMDPSTQILSSPIGTPNALPSNQSFLPSGGVSVIRCM